MVLIAIQVHNLSLVDIEQFLIPSARNPKFWLYGRKIFCVTFIDFLWT